MATTQELLDQARAALHALATGSSVVEVRNGEIVTRYAQANIDSLRTYITTLEAAQSPRRPFDVLWGR